MLINNDINNKKSWFLEILNVIYEKCLFIQNKYMITNIEFLKTNQKQNLIPANNIILNLSDLLCVG